MMLFRLGRLAPTAAVAVLLGACADSSTVLAPIASPFALAADVGVTAEGDLQICKVGNAAGTFTFDVSYDPRPVGGVMSAPRADDQVSVDVGTCATLPTINTGRYVASVTEQAPPAFWALTDLVVTSNQPGFAGGPVVIDLANRTASNIGISNDNGATITFTNTYTPPPAGCTYTQGYWKTHSEFGPAPYDATWAQLPAGASTTFFLSGTTWIEVFGTPPKGNAYYQLAHQYMAAQLNLLSGADPTAVSAELSQAETLFNTYTPAQIAALGKKSPVIAQMLAIASTLDDYNNGIIGPGHCN